MKKFLPLLLLSVILFDASAQHTYNEITLPALMKKRNGNASNMVIVDVRSNAEYYDSSSRFKNGNIGRIKDVVHIELQELEKAQLRNLLLAGSLFCFPTFCFISNFSLDTN